MLAHQKQMEVVAAIVEASDNPCLGVDTGDSLNFFRDKNDIDVFFDFLRDGDQKIKSVSSGRPVQIVHLPGDHAINKPGRKGLGYILDTDPVSAICAMQKQVVPIFQKINNVSSGGQVAILAIDDNLYHRNYLRYLDSINEEHKLKAEMVANNDFSLSIQEYLIRLAVDYKNNGGMLITCSHSHIPRKYFKDLIGSEDILVHGHMHWPNDNSILFRSIRYPHLTFKRGHPRVLTVGAPFFPLPNSGASFHREPVLVKVDINSKGTVEYEFV